MNRKKKLSTRLMVIPLMCTILVCICLSGGFHLLMKQYLNDITNDSMDETFDSRYDDANSPATYEREDRVFFLVYTIVIDPFIDPEKPIGEWYTDNERQLSEKILHEMETKGYLEERVRHTITIDQQTYLVEKRKYKGFFDDYSIKASEAEGAKDYEMLVYINITSTHRIIEAMDKIIIALSVIFCGLIVLLNFMQLRSISRAFNMLKMYLLQVGKREKPRTPPEVAYEEFEQVVDTVEAMAAQIEQSELLQKQFFQNASHELRTPLMSIQGYTEGLIHHVIDEEQGLEVIYRQSQKMSRLVDDILYLSKFETRAFKKEAVDLHDILYQAVDYQSGCDTKGIEVAFEMPEKLPMIGDEELLEKIFDNILSNAYRYAKTRIRITGTLEAEKVVVHISDDGEGIAPEDIEHIFERFYKGKNGNFGIGLSMVAEGVEKHQGQIKVASEVGCTTFTLIFPRK